MRAAVAAGVTLIGENYVQEAEGKKGTIREPVEWHMIGHLQRNKVKIAAQLFDAIETLDSIALAQELAKEGQRTSKIIRTLVEVNLSGEKSKTGITEERVPALLEAVGELTHLTVEGFMTVPPLKENPEETRPYFRALRELLLRHRKRRIANVDLRELSMGMTHDYQVAIEEGATIVRIGTALFGARKD